MAVTNHLAHRFRSLIADERGATAIEYALILSLMVLALLGALVGTGGGVGAKWSDVANKVSSVL